MPTGKNKKPLLVICSTSQTNVANLGDRLDKLAEKYELHYLLPKGRTFVNEPAVRNSYFFSGKLNKTNLGLIMACAKVRPSAVAILYGDDFWHDNVVDAVLCICKALLLRPIKIYLLSPTHGITWRIRDNYGVAATVAAYLLFPAALAALWLSSPGIALFAVLFLLLFQFAYLLMRGFHFLFAKNNPYELCFKKTRKAFGAEIPAAYTLDEHERRGYSNAPNLDIRFEWSCEELSLAREFRVKTDSLGRRLAAPPNSSSPGAPVISFYGCSMTFGDCLHDHETFPWLVGELLPDYTVYNYGVSGYSMYQVFLTMQDSIATDKPKFVVVGYFEEIEERNTLYSVCHNNNLFFTSIKFPVCIFNNRKLREYSPRAYIRVLGSKFFGPLLFLEYAVNAFRFRKSFSSKFVRGTNEHVLLRMKELCERNGAKMLVACLTNSEKYHSFFMKHRFNWCYSGVNYRKDQYELEKYTFHPLDKHPNQECNMIFAENIYGALRTLEKEPFVTPDFNKISVRSDPSTAKPAKMTKEIYPLY